MGHRKFIVDIFIIALAFLLFVIWDQNNKRNTVQTAAIPDEQNIDVYLISSNNEKQFWSQINQGATDMAELMDIRYYWLTPGERSAESMITTIEQAVEAGAEALMIAPDDPAAITQAIEAAKASGVKVVYIATPPNKAAIITLSTDDYKAGVKAGKTLISILEDKGKLNGSIGIINRSQRANAKLREEGFRSVLEKDGRYKLLDTVYIESDDPEEAQIAAERLMQEYKELVALFGVSEGTSVGVGNANRASGNQYTGIGFERSDQLMRLLQGESLNAVIAENPYTMGYLGMAQAVAAVRGEDTGPDYINTGVTVHLNYR
jgi:ribose transport system substrate-binding protein